MDAETRRSRLEAWLRAHLGQPELELGPLETPGHGGMSADTQLAQARVGDEQRGFAIRLDPGEDGIFPTYDLAGEFDLLRTLGEDTEVPVPPMIGHEPDPDVVGRPFYVAGRVPGRVPADRPPFQLRGWLHDAEPAEQARAQASTLEALAAVHRVDAEGLDLRVPARERFGPPGLDQDLAYWRHYLDWTQQDGEVPLLEAAYAWCVERRPAHEPASTLCWGDARYPNAVFDEDFEVAALLDWEMTLLGPPELDVGWLVFLHEVALMWFDDLPGFRSREDTLACYEQALGRELRDLDWHVAWGGVRAAAIQPKLTLKRYQQGQVEDLSERHENAVTLLLRRLIPDLPPPPGGTT